MTKTVKSTRNIPVIIAGIIGWAHDGFALVLVSLLATTLVSAFNVSNIVIGFVFSAQYIMTVFGASFFGELADRFGRKNILLISVLWDSIFTAFSAFALILYFHFSFEPQSRQEGFHEFFHQDLVGNRILGPRNFD